MEKSSKIRSAEDEHTVLAIAANLALDNVEAIWKKASPISIESFWQKIEAKQFLGETRLYQVLHAFLFNDDYQVTPIILRQTDVERLHEMLVLLRNLRNQHSHHWFGDYPTVPDKLVGLLCSRLEQAVKHCAQQNQFALLSYEELVSSLCTEKSSGRPKRPGEIEDYRRSYLFNEKNKGRPCLTLAGKLFFLGFFLSTQQMQRLLGQIQGFYKTFKTSQLFRRAVIGHFSRRDAHSILGAATASRDFAQVAKRNLLFAQDEFIRTAQTLIDLPAALDAPEQTPSLNPELAHSLGVADARLERHQARWLRRAIAYLTAQLTEENPGLADQVQWRSRPRHEVCEMEPQVIDSQALPGLLGKARAPRRVWLGSGELDVFEVAVDHGHVHCRLQHPGKPPFVVTWKLHVRTVRALLEAHFLYAIPINAFFEKLLNEGMKWQYRKPFEFLAETDLPSKLRRFSDGNPQMSIDIERLKQRIDQRLQVLIGRMERIEKALRQPYSPLFDPKPERKSEIRSPSEAREALQLHNINHHRHAKNRLILRIYQSFLPQEHKLKPSELQILSIYHYTLRPPRPDGKLAGAAREADSRLLDKARDAFRGLPQELQYLAFGAGEMPRPNNLNELLLRVTGYARRQWQSLREELPAYNLQQTHQRARVLHLGVSAQAVGATDQGGGAKDDNAKTLPAFALPLTRVAVGRMANKLAGQQAGFHKSTRHWAIASRTREAAHFNTEYYRAKRQSQTRRREQEIWEDYESDAALLSTIAGHWLGRCFPAIGKDFMFNADFLTEKRTWNLPSGQALNLSLAEAARVRLLSHQDKAARLVNWCLAQGRQADELSAEDLRRAQDELHQEGALLVTASLRLEKELLPHRPANGNAYYPFTQVLEQLRARLPTVTMEELEWVSRARNCALHVDIPEETMLYSKATATIEKWLAALTKNRG